LKVFPITVLLGLAVILVWSFNLASTGSVFAQTSDPGTDPNAGPIPEGNYTDTNTGPIPEDNGTSPYASSVPQDNSTNLGTSPDMGAPSDNPLANETPDNMTSPENITPPVSQPSPSTMHVTANSSLPPLEQVKSGTSPKDVQCKQGFTLIIKVDDGSPACVRPNVAQILIHRGW
jgi:hypothetical protein